jgi:replication-associated recombination protein RarA
MQKEIRRGNAGDAMYWASELLISGYDGYCWKRLMIILVEDIDIFNAGLASDFWAYYGIAMEGRKKRGRDSNRDERENLALMAAVTRMAMAKKSRVNCTATDFYCKLPREAIGRKEIPDYALDRHTSKGKRMGRDFDHFFDEGAKINDVEGNLINDEPDPFREIVRDYLKNPKAFEGQPAPKKDGDDLLF